jgi:putative addiction module killer protein
MQIEFHDEREFERWLFGIGNERASRVSHAIRRAAELGGSWAGLPLVRYLGAGLYEVRRGGDRVYFQQSRHALTILTAGRKDTQDRDIARARRRMT